MDLFKKLDDKDKCIKYLQSARNCVPMDNSAWHAAYDLICAAIDTVTFEDRMLNKTRMHSWDALRAQAIRLNIKPVST